MPKGRVPEHTATCRACGGRFVTDRCGKAAYYCRTAACDAERARSKITVPNSGTSRPRSRLTPEERARREADRERRRQQAEADRRERVQARERAKAEREARQEADRRNRAAEKRRKELERDAEQRRKRVAREAEQRKAEAKKLRARLEQLRPKVNEATEVMARLRELEGGPVQRATVAQGAATRKATAAVERLSPGTSGAYDELHREVTRRLLAGDVDRSSLGRCVRQLAEASGIRLTGEALHKLAVEALAWESRLVGSGPEIVARRAA